VHGDHKGNKIQRGYKQNEALEFNRENVVEEDRGLMHDHVAYR
jgi:hypothetical protein